MEGVELWRILLLKRLQRKHPMHMNMCSSASKFFHRQCKRQWNQLQYSSLDIGYFPKPCAQILAISFILWLLLVLGTQMRLLLAVHRWEQPCDYENEFSYVSIRAFYRSGNNYAACPAASIHQEVSSGMDPNQTWIDVCIYKKQNSNQKKNCFLQIVQYILYDTNSKSSFQNPNHKKWSGSLSRKKES